VEESRKVSGGEESGLVREGSWETGMARARARKHERERDGEGG
jgi:hypothetical protein